MDNKTHEDVEFSLTRIYQDTVIELTDFDGFLKFICY